jgi:hypothetical protein
LRKASLFLSAVTPNGEQIFTSHISAWGASAGPMELKLDLIGWRGEISVAPPEIH